MSDAAPLLIGRRENQIILDKISHGPRPRVTLQVWWAALACAAPDTGTIQATQRQLAEQAGTTETGVSRALSQLTQIGALTRIAPGRYALNPLIQGNPRQLYGLLFAAAADTLLAFGRDPRWIGGEIGITLVLHSWGQNLGQHVHVHGLVTAGGLSPDGGRWLPARRRFLFPVRALSRVFRGKYLELLVRAHRRGTLAFGGSTAALADRPAFMRFIATLRRADWVVYAKPPFAGPEQVIAYLGRYTHRVAIANDRLVALEDDHVSFRWRDYRDGARCKTMRLEAVEFIRRFLLHVLPQGFMRIRHYGLFANQQRRAKLARCRELLAQPEPKARSEESVAAMMRRITGRDILACPHCGEGRLQVVAILRPQRWTAHYATGPP
jgi:hypothetical protein